MFYKIQPTEYSLFTRIDTTNILFARTDMDYIIFTCNSLYNILHVFTRYSPTHIVEKRVFKLFPESLHVFVTLIL